MLNTEPECHQILAVLTDEDALMSDLDSSIEKENNLVNNIIDGSGEKNRERVRVREGEDEGRGG